jgi:DNA-binding beta-propeller fold protein YncE
MKSSMLIVLAAVMAGGAQAHKSEQSYAQYLVEQALARHPQVLALTMHVTPPGAKGNVIIASNIAPLGTPADPDDLRVIESRQPLVKVTKGGDRLAVELPLYDASRRAIGALGVQLGLMPGADRKALEASAAAIRDELARRISHIANLVEPASYDERVPLNNYGQRLVDDMLGAHPEIVILALHANVPKTDDNVIVASNIGRIGKKGDEDDLRLIKTEKPNLEINDAGDRFEAELVLRDVSGTNIGAVGIVYGYKQGDDKIKLQRQAETVQAALARRITNAANLFEPVPYVPNPPDAGFAQQLVDATLSKHPDLLILALHARPPGAPDVVIIASNIGRIGKKADEDDMGVITSGKPILEVNEAGNRFEVELVLLDSAGRNVGAISSVFAYKPGADREALHRRGERIRDELRTQIPSLGKLFEPGMAGAPLLAAPARADSPPILQAAGRTELPGYSGDFDHFGTDLPGNRLFLAAEDHGTLEVFNLKSGAHEKTVAGLETPHSILYIPDMNRLLITNSGSGMTKVLDATTYEITGSIKLVPGADSIGFDEPRDRLYVVTGGKDVDLKYTVLAEIDPRTGKQAGAVTFAANHVEAMAVEQHGNRLYINVTDKNYLAVIDKDKRSVVAQWPIKEAEQNAPVAFDEANHRLFIVTRKPGMLVVLNAMTGESIAHFKAPERCDEVVFDAANRRIYVAGGEGFIGVYRQVDADHYTQLASVPSAKGAKTAVLVPALHRLYLAVSPGEGVSSGGGIMWFNVLPAAP